MKAITVLKLEAATYPRIVHILVPVDKIGLLKICAVNVGTQKQNGRSKKPVNQGNLVALKGKKIG